MEIINFFRESYSKSAFSIYYTVDYQGTCSKFLLVLQDDGNFSLVWTCSVAKYEIMI